MQAQIDPSVYDAILGYGGQTAAMDPQIEYQQQLAKQLRQAGQMPGLIDAGRRMVAPSKWAFAGALANQAVAGSHERGAMSLQQQQAALRQLQVQKVLDALQSKGAAPAASAGWTPEGSTPQAGV